MHKSPDFEDRDVSTTSDHDVDALRGEAARCRRLASSVLDKRTLEALNAMAHEYEAKATKAGRVRS